ncbi:MAG: GNAT family N-acetyltransferase [Bosea sp. (in: a-proteobacteria)]|uniref:GNAT family N-acetyltransferase n=1 Tax=Bosea sp. (in: a-proteobacteria) TaxID=1871050 RepID=UPI0027341F37|nr:GNAT family N-acetyltransferase [Bosea sp. (in: a-proteobacteria)]MDP3255580.1 GNAT family N-acetyltransferase [Bosea sp. (in: a-proteobacteria)]MDP3320436.1 GNAT family N-acetyltransferase [Bosea sp. (in: a-proteobacteria)]
MSTPPSDDVAFLPVEPHDLPLLAGWIAQPHWQEWWGDPETEVGYIRDMIEGRDDTCSPFLITLAGTPAGYIQVWRVGRHQIPAWTAGNPWLLEVPAEAVGVDLSLADARRLSQGIGSAALRRFAESLVAQGHETILIDPDPANARAVAAYRKAGFRPVPHLEGRTPGVLIMQFQQDSDLT